MFKRNYLRHLKFWSRCGQDTDFTAPMIGNGCSKTGTPTYAAGKFGNGSVGTTGANWVCNPTNYWTSTLKGTFELWIKYTTGWDSDWWYVMVFTDGVNGKPTLRIVKLGTGSAFRIAYGINAGNTYISYDDAQANYTINIWYHLAIVWDSTGIDGTSHISRIYKDNSIIASSETGIGEIDWITQGNIGNYHLDLTRYPRGVIDSVKIYDIAKTNFEDRFMGHVGRQNIIS